MTDSTAATTALEEALLASALAHPERVERTIDPRDEMLLFPLAATGGDRTAARADYFALGLRIFAVVRQLADWRFGGLDRLDAVLDFASGYGRVTRVLAAELPAERIWASDIYDDALEFQRRHLGVHTVPSGPRPEDFVCARDFDFILVSSLFSHLPAASFHGWLARLVERLSPRGLLAFTVHDASLLPPDRELPPSGIFFTAASESRSLDPAQYGSSWVSEAFVRAAVTAIDPAARCLRLPRGHCNFQDLYLVARGATPPLAGLELDAGPEGFLERCELSDHDTVLLRGWALEGSRDRPAAAIEALVPGTAARASLVPGEPRPDIAALVPDPRAGRCGFELELPLPPGDDPLARPLLVQAVSARGMRTVLAAGTLGGARFAAARLEINYLLGEVAGRDQRIATLEHEAAVARHEAATRAARIAAMEASRFWRARNAWFAVKRALRLTDET